MLKKKLWHKRYFWFFCEMRQDMLDVTYSTKRIIYIKFYVLSCNLLWKPIVIPNLRICRVTEKIMKNKRFMYLNWSVWRIIFVAIRNIKLANVIIGLLTEALVTLAQMWHCTLFKCLWFEHKVIFSNTFCSNPIIFCHFIVGQQGKLAVKWYLMAYEKNNGPLNIKSIQKNANYIYGNLC